MPYIFMLLFLKILILNCAAFATNVERIDSSFTSVVSNISREELVRLKNRILEVIDPYVKIEIYEAPPNCVQIQCKFVCFNGKSADIPSDINITLTKAKVDCPVLEELRLYNYEFTDNIISYGFLGNFSARVTALYIASSNVTDILAGSFANGIFEVLHFEDLLLRELRKDFFNNISRNFRGLSIIQKSNAVESVCDDFLDKVKYQIQSLTLQVGVNCLRNLTASSNLLNNLAYADFSYNNFTNHFAPDSFNKLSVVESLDLSHSRVTHLPDYIFSDILETLEYLDLSNNRLLTISRTVFTWREIPLDLRIILNDNPWDCSCQLRSEMNSIFATQSMTMFCATPEQYENWSVFDIRLCAEQTMPENSTTVLTTTITPTTTTVSTSTAKSTTDNWATTLNNSSVSDGSSGGGESIGTKTTTTQQTGAPYAPTTAVGEKTTKVDEPTDEDTILLYCTNTSDVYWHKVLWPSLQFQLRSQADFSVEVTLDTDDSDVQSHGMVWFSRVTGEYYKMEVNYNEYGLGCYSPVPYRTIVDDLLPDTAYTFCLVLKDQLTVSPFSCDSVHVYSNVGIKYSAWLRRDMRGTGISLVILGIVLFNFAGMCVVYLILKRKPTLLKGSKRVGMTRSNAQEIVVFPKNRTYEDFRLKEEMLAKRNSKSTNSSSVRRSSMESVVSYESYMNANLYEVIPAYLKLHEVANEYERATQLDSVDSYVMPLAVSSCTALDSNVCYATVPPRPKRTSNDPLPEVPDEAPPPVAELATSLQDSAATSEQPRSDVHMNLSSQV